MRCFIGVDLGTSMSGYAYAFSSEPASIKHPSSYTQDDPGTSTKTDTALLFEVLKPGSTQFPAQWRLDCWGSRAVNKYTTELSTETAQHFRLITGRQFKLALETDPSSLPWDCQLPPDCPYSAPELASLMLQCLQQHAAQWLWDSAQLNLAAQEVHFCLSVPAGWSLRAKRVMHYAAEKAGMTFRRQEPPDDLCRHSSASSSSSSYSRSYSDSRQARDQQLQGTSEQEAASAVVLIHEQEAAALSACIDPQQDLPTLTATPGQVWVVVDAGGGTVDIALHKVEASPRHPGECQLTERLRSRCLLWGSRTLDVIAEQRLLLPLFGGSVAAYQQWRVEDGASYMSQMREWEAVKTRWDGVSPMFLKLDYELLQRVPANAPGLQRGRLQVSADFLQRQVFDPVLDEILSQLREMLQTPRTPDGVVGADVLVLAGGFGSSPYLHRRLVQEFKQTGLIRGAIARPNNASKAVLMGNTIYLQRPDAISARVSRLTYGVNVAERPQPGCRKHGSCETDAKQREWCTSHFIPLVKIHDVVNIGDTTEPLNVYPMPGEAVVHVPVYATEAVDAMHVTDPGMRRIGTLSVSVNKAHRFNMGLIKAGRMSSDKYQVQLRFRFGLAELQVQAYDVTNKCASNVSFSFSSEAPGAEHNWHVDLPGPSTGPRGTFTSAVGVTKMQAAGERARLVHL